MRSAKLRRKTRETDVEVSVNLDGEGSFSGSTGLRFLDHMLTLLAHHSLIDLEVRSSWDLAHHGVEDVAITLGQAIDQALGDRSRIYRFGYAIVPMDDSLAEVAVDMAGRAYSRIDANFSSNTLEDMKAEDYVHFLQSLSVNLRAVIHINVRYGSNDHHKAEAAIKALAIALRRAVAMDPSRVGIPSSKGVL